MRMRARTEELLPFALLLPSLVYLGLLILIPMVQALLLAVQADTGGFTTEHFERMLVDVNFNDAWRNTLLLLVLIVPLQIVLALAMALLLRVIGPAWPPAAVAGALSHATALVVFVIYLFLGSWRAAFIPAAVIPVCLIGAFLIMMMFGFSFAFQWGVGAVLRLYPAVDGRYAPEGYSAALAILAALQLATLAWLLPMRLPGAAAQPPRL